MINKESNVGITTVVNVKKRSISNIFFAVSVVLLYLIFFCVKVYAADVAPADPGETLWTALAGLVGTWVTRLGAVIMFIGAVMFGLGWKNDDADQKSRGVQTIIGGAIVTAVAAMVDVFFA